MKIIATYLSPLLASSWDEQARSPAPILDPSNHRIYWFDKLLHGGLHLPADSDRPLIVLIAGPPGVGKSLFIQQLCYARAREFIVGTPPPYDAFEASSVIISSEAQALSILENLERLGLDQCSRQRWCAFDALDRSGLQNFRRQGSADLPLMQVASTQAFRASGADLVDAVSQAWIAATERQVGEAPFLLAIDSLNVVSRSSRQRAYFDELLHTFSSRSAWLSGPERPKALLLVLDTPQTYSQDLPPPQRHWEYVADLSIRFGSQYVPYGEHDQYYIRRVEIVKARFQPHALGAHVAKILQKPKRVLARNRVTSEWIAADSIEECKATLQARAENSEITHSWDITPSLATDPEGPRPNVWHGGVFVLPSLHYILSQVRSRQPLVRVMARAASGTVPWPVKGMTALVGSEMPLHECTAIIGQRGPRKGYLAYQFLLDGIGRGERTVVVSFRDNQKEIREILRTVIEEQGHNAQLSDDNPLVIYQRPGCVTPDELLHRIMAVIGEHSPGRLVLYAVDEWQATQPLLAEATLLMPTLMDVLKVHGVTSMIVCIADGTASLAEQALRAHAEVVLSFEYRVMPCSDPVLFRQSEGLRIDGFERGVSMAVLPTGMQPLQKPQVVVRAVRVPRALGALRRAVFDWEFGSQREKPRLVMTALAPEYPEGGLIQ